MKYEDARKMIRNGDVLTFSGSWLFSKLIRWWTRQSVSHVGLAMWLRFGIETEDRLCVIESMEPYGVRILPLTLVMPEYLSGSCNVYWQSYIGGNGDAVLGDALKNWGRGYANWFQFLTIISPTYRKLRHRFHGNIHIGSGYTCSELVALAFLSAGMVLDKDPAIMTPGDFHNCHYLSKPEKLE